jgi:release factor glutamine methyltransferase
LDLPKIIGEALALGRHALSSISETPNLDAQLLLSEVAGQPRAWVLAHPEAGLSSDQAMAFAHALTRYQGGEALPYILGWWEFYTRVFRLTPAVLIPRPETELIVEAALAFLSDRPGDKLALDVGTGSGCIAVTLALESSGVCILASDLSMEALQVARRNVSEYGVGARVRLIQADLATPFRGGFDLVCANLPYVTSREMRTLAVAQREPQLALDGGANGMALIDRMLQQIPSILSPGGLAIMEIGAGQGAAVRKLARRLCPQAKIEVRVDLAGLDRLLLMEDGGST